MLIDKLRTRLRRLNAEVQKLRTNINFPTTNGRVEGLKQLCKDWLDVLNARKVTQAMPPSPRAVERDLGDFDAAADEQRAQGKDLSL